MCLLLGSVRIFILLELSEISLKFTQEFTQDMIYLLSKGTNSN